jgi:hypothetical protein
MLEYIWLLCDKDFDVERLCTALAMPWQLFYKPVQFSVAKKSSFERKQAEKI